jgi:hypothetical protein
MGWSKGKGLGKDETGRVEPLDALAAASTGGMGGSLEGSRKGVGAM